MESPVGQEGYNAHLCNDSRTLEGIQLRGSKNKRKIKEKNKQRRDERKINKQRDERKEKINREKRRGKKIEGKKKKTAALFSIRDEGI